MQPDRAAGGRELGGIFQKIRNHPLQLGRVKRQLWQLLVGQEVERQASFLKAVRPEAADFGQAGIHIAGLVPHLHLAGFENACSSENPV